MQVEEDGIVFFRESCFRQSGDKARKSNPTHYRCASSSIPACALALAALATAKSGCNVSV